MTRPTTRLRLTSLEDRLTPAGGLDPTFGTGGLVTTAPGKFGTWTSVVAQPDGRLVVVDSAGPNGARVTRYNADGTLDAGFGTRGTVENLLPGDAVYLGDPVVGPDGKITLAGTATVADTQSDPAPRYRGHYNTTVFRLNPDGTPDATFGVNGVVALSDDVAIINYGRKGLALQADGSVVVVGSEYLGGQYLAVRLTPSGAVDPTYGGDGRAEVLPGGIGNNSYADLVDVATLPGGGLVILADLGPGVALVRVTATGTLDTAFDGDGVWTSLADGASYALAVQPDGKVLLTTQTYDPRDSGVQVLRLNPDGTPDASFGGDGTVVALTGTGAGLALLADGRVLVASAQYEGGRTGVAVLNPDGTPDGDFAGDYGHSEFLQPGDESLTLRVEDLAVSGDRVVVLSTLQSGYNYIDLRTRIGLAVLTERSDALPFPPKPPAVENLGMPYVIEVPPSEPPVCEELPVIEVPPPPLSPGLLGDPVTVSDVPPPFNPPDRVDLLADPIPPPPQPLTLLPTVRKMPGDVNADGVADKLVTDGPRLSVVSGKDGTVLIAPFAPFEASYTGTLNAVFVDVDGNGEAELVVSPSRGGGPVVAVYNADGTERGRFWGIDDSGFRGGVSLASGDVNGDGRPDLIVTAGEGGGPRVAIFDGRNLGANSKRLVADFFAFESGQRGGATAGVANGVLIFAAGPGSGPRVRGIDARSLFVPEGVKSLDDLPASARRFDRFVGDSSSRRGVTLDFSGVDNSVTDRPAKVTADSGDGKPESVYEVPGFGPAT